MWNNSNMRAFRDTYGLKIIGHENPNNNLLVESLSTSYLLHMRYMPQPFHPFQIDHCNNIL
jgi:hypothetical protein